MDIAITTTGNDLVLESLFRWLRETDEVARAANLEMSQSANIGRMGALEIINVTLTNTIAFSAVVMSYAAWRKAHGEMAEVTFDINGVSVTVNNASPDTVQRLLALAEQRATGEAVRSD
ncbi:effector-associated constant component EACC1 [Plantactinospora endophytica]|uniref:Uncharacterized protein n=1 Tax=Plantactinospora endophytica TaxID=673535 RepID=A0ABQ4DWV3_9ACTN|nr:hypothetical protein [Plantactinospora endophytica]GIG86939.1 hypothetical protein Pen02_18750 [Plantactinospora endophytica]